MSGHKYRVYVDNHSKGTYAYKCECGKSEGDYVHKAYARDGWRESHGLDPEINYPLV